MMATHVWLDCDPGHDDAFAILLALGNARIILDGISTTAGNQTLAKTTANAVRMTKLVGGDRVPIVQGLARPLLAPGLICPEIHGESGLDMRASRAAVASAFQALGNSHDALPENGILYLRNWLLASAEPVTVVATGCLTNIAALLVTFPEVKPKIKEIVILGGAIENPQGNVGVVSEFNILLDPHAAQIVFHSSVKVVLVTLEVSHRVLVTDAVRKRLNEQESPLDEFCMALFEFFSDTYSSVFAMPDPPLHDPLAMAYVVRPEIFRTRHLNVEVETNSPLTLGQTVVDLLGVSKREPNVHVALEVNVDEFWNVMFEAIENLRGKCVLKK